jgi:hypothetical protein
VVQEEDGRVEGTMSSYPRDWAEADFDDQKPDRAVPSHGLNKQLGDLVLYNGIR